MSVISTFQLSVADFVIREPGFQCEPAFNLPRQTTPLV